MIKNILKLSYKLLILLAVAVSFGLVSCNDNSGSDGTPTISYVRITDPAKADSTITAAKQGQYIAIIGENLQSTRQIWFNDQQASISPAYITNKSIVCVVPSTIPLVVDNKLKLVFASGDSLLYDFQITISGPYIQSADREYALEGETMNITGSYFYYPLTITFPGGVSVTSGNKANADVAIDASNTILTVKVPTGATTPGPITITSNFGSATSPFWFHDNRGLFEGFESKSGTNIITTPGIGDPPAINGKYCRIIRPSMGSWSWVEVYANWGGPGYKIPDDAILNPSLYYFKFEVCTMKPFNNNGIRLFFTDLVTANTDAGGTKYYNWPVGCGKSPNPLIANPFNTNGLWATVSIPLADIRAANPSLTAVQPNGYFVCFVYCEGGTLDCDMSFDNFRVVPMSAN